MAGALQFFSDLTALELTIFVLVSFVGGALPMITGQGGALLLIALYTFFLPANRVIPIVAIVMVLAHLVRIGIWRQHVVWPIVGRFFIGVVPGALLGTYLFSLMPASLIAKLLGVFLVSFAIYSWFKPKLTVRIQPWWYTPIGSIAGFLSAIVGGAGPFTAVFLVSGGLAGPAFAITAMATQLAAHATKTVGYGLAGVLTATDVFLALSLFAIVLPSIFVGKWLAERLDRQLFRRAVIVTLFVLGARFLLLS